MKGWQWIKKLSTGIQIVFLILLFFLMVLLGHLLFRSVQLDLTEGNRYTLSDSSREMVQSLESPLVIYFFFSETQLKGSPLSDYGLQIARLLKQYAKSTDKIRLEMIEPKVFSEEEDLAASMGLSSLSPQGTPAAFLGLAIEDSQGRRLALPVFDPARERLLEYDISQIIYRMLHVDNPIKIGLISSLPLAGERSMATGAVTPPSFLYDQLSQLYDIRSLSSDFPDLDGLDLLVLVQPKLLTPHAIYAIEQFVFRGGKLLVFVDSWTEQFTPEFMDLARPDERLMSLFHHWGVNVHETRVLADHALGLLVQTDQSKDSVRHLGILGLGFDSLNPLNPITANLGQINLSSSSFLSFEPNINYEWLLRSSDKASDFNAGLFDQLLLSQGSEGFTHLKDQNGEPYVIAASVEINTTSLLNKLKLDQKRDDHQDSVSGAQMVIVADTNLLQDKYWLTVKRSGQQMFANMFADNGFFFFNAIDYLVGGESLLNVRSSAKSLRPFDRVEKLRLEAESHFLEKEAVLSQSIRMLEDQLVKFDQRNQAKQIFFLTPTEEKEREKLLNQIAEARRALRQVGFLLNEDIKRLGQRIKLINGVVFPLLVGLILGLIYFYQVRMPALKRRRN